MATSGGSNAIGSVRAAKSTLEKVWSAFSGIRQTKFSQLDASQKSTFFLMYPHLKQREKMIDQVANVGAAAMSFFGVVYVGVEISGALGLMTAGLLFNWISLALLLTGFAIYVVTTLAREFMFTRACETLLDEGGLYLVFEQISEMRAETNRMTDKLSALRNHFKTMGVGAQDYRRVIIDAALLNIQYATDFLDSKSQANLENEILNFRDPDSTVSNESEEDTLDEDRPIADQQYYSSGFRRPKDAFNIERAHHLHLEVLEEFKKINENIVILELLEQSIRQDLSPNSQSIVGSFYDQSDLKLFAGACQKAASHAFTADPSQAHALRSSSRGNRLLPAKCPINLLDVKRQTEIDRHFSSAAEHGVVLTKSPALIFVQALCACFALFQDVSRTPTTNNR